VQSDGEVLGTTPMSVEVLPRALAVIVPASSRLAGGHGGR
jgi:diacylglycerol kinase family enzyme